MNSQSNWTLEIRPNNGWFNLNLTEIWKYRDLIFLFVRRDFIAIYKQTILGPLWFFIQPLLTTIVFTVIFSNIAQIPTDGLPPLLFYMAGTVMWSYFASCLTQTSNTFITNANLFGKVYFPRLVVPISLIITNLLTFLIQFTLFLGFLLLFIILGSPIYPSWWILILPLLILQMALFGLGMGVLISSLTTKYRDLTFALGFGVQLWLYATPIVYPLSQIPDKWIWIYSLNPMTAIVETFRHAFLGSGMIQPWMLVISIIVSIIVLFIGIMTFNHVEKTFMDTV